MSRQSNRYNDARTLDDLIEEIIVDAYGDDEQLSAFCQVIEDEVPLPADGFVIGEPVSEVKIDYDGNERRGLTARCRREDGSEHIVAASEVVFSKGSIGATYLAAYRKWLGPQPGYEILSNKYFYRYQPPTPADELLSEFWRLQKEAEALLKGLAK